MAEPTYGDFFSGVPDDVPDFFAQFMGPRPQAPPPPAPPRPIGPVAQFTPMAAPGPAPVNMLPQALQVNTPTAGQRTMLPRTRGLVSTTARTPPAQPVTPEPTTGAAPAAPAAPSALEGLATAYESADKLRNEAYDKLTPTEEQLEGYRRSGMTGQMAAIALQMLGDEPQQALGGHILKQSMAEMEKGKRDPWKVGEMEAKKLDAQATALENRAKFAVSIDEKREATRLAAEARRDAMQLRADIARATLEMRGMTMGMTAQNQAQTQQQHLFQREHQLRSDYQKVTKDITDGQRAAQQIVSIVPAQIASMNAQQQQALIFSFMKLLDPSSVVRESEYASAAKARGVFDTIGNYSTYLQTGKPLTPTQVANMVKLGHTLMESMGELKIDINSQFETTARSWGVDPRNFISGPTLRMPNRAPNRASDVPAVQRDAPVADRGRSFIQ